MTQHYTAHIRADGTEQTCAEHCRQTAAYAREVLEDIHLGAAGYLAGLLHDAGKFTRDFDTYIHSKNGRRGSVIHSYAGAAYLLKAHHFPEDGNLGFSDISAEVMASAIASHHGLIDLCDDGGQSGFDKRKTHQTEYDDRAMKAFFSECASEAELDGLFLEASAELTEALSHLPEPGEDGTETCFYAGALSRLLTSAVVTADRRDTAEFMNGQSMKSQGDTDWAACSRQILTYLNGFEGTGRLDEARRAFSDACAEAANRAPGVYRLNLPTGSGKTLSVLRYAAEHARLYNKRRIIYTAPLLTIIEQNARAIRDALGGSVSVLEHHSAVVQEQRSSDRDELNMDELLQETWDSPVIITTLVRLLDIFFSGKMADVRRFSALSNSVIIFDEVQSLPLKLTSLFTLMLNFLVKRMGATVVLCSATQPGFEHASRPLNVNALPLIPDELREKYDPLFVRTEISDEGHMRLDGIAVFARERLQDTRSLLIICNTKREAARLFLELEDLPGVRAFHLSAGMCMAHRKQVLAALEEALDREEPLVCVSTQVIEAGIDISFAEVIRLSAGLDSVIQAAGRCNRNGEYAEPRPVHIIRAEDERLGNLTEIQHGQDALNQLLALERFAKEPASETAVSYYYGALYRSLKQGAQDCPLKDAPTLYELLADNSSRINLYDNGKTMYPYFLTQSFKDAGARFTVFDDDTISVAVPYGEGEDLIAELESERGQFDPEYARDLIEKLKPYTVSVFAGVLNRMLRDGLIRKSAAHDIFLLNPEAYDGKIGITNEETHAKGETECDTLIL